MSVTTPRSGSPLRIGTRGSLLATTQAGTVRDALIAAGHPAELVIIKTKGDQSTDPVQKIGVGVFTAELREALLDNRVDVAVHSYKDLPTAQDPRFVIAAIPPREDPRDALVARDGLVLGELPAGSKVGTSAPRRVSQLKALGLGLDIVPLRGNLQRRLGKVESGELDAVILARAGLSRIGLLDLITENIEPVQMLPLRPRVLWPSNASLPIRNWRRSWPSTTTPVPARRSLPSVPCSPSWKPAAPRRSVRSRRSSNLSTTTAESSTNCRYAAAQPPSTVRTSSVPAQWVRRTRPRNSAER